MLQTEADLRAYLRDTFGVTIPETACCPEHTSPWQAFVDAYFARHSMTVWVATRGSGKSLNLALLGVVEAIAQNAEIVILGGSAEQSERVHTHMARFWSRPAAPRELLAAEPTATETLLVGGAWVQALAGSVKSVRGPHPNKLRIDEADDMDLALFDAAMGQTLSTGDQAPAQTVVSSTYHRPRGTMRELLRRAADKGWPVYRWCTECVAADRGGWLPRAEIARKQTEVTARMWRVEYQGERPELDEVELSSAVLTRTFARRPGERFAGAIEEYLEFEPPFVLPAPDPQSIEARWNVSARRDLCWIRSGQYAHGADWARTTDRTVLVVLRVDVRPWRLVAFWAFHRLDWPVMVGRFDELLRRYPGQAASDATGIGDVVQGYIQQPDRVEGVKLVGQMRADILTEHIRATQAGEWVSPYIESLVQDHEVTAGDLFGGGHPPDGFVAAALATRAAARIRPRGDLGLTLGR